VVLLRILQSQKLPQGLKSFSFEQNPQVYRGFAYKHTDFAAMAKAQAKKYQRTLGKDCEFHPLELWRGITDKELRDSGPLHLIVDRSDCKGIAEEIRLLKSRRPSPGGIDYSEVSLRLEKYYNHWRLEGIFDYSVGREGISISFGNQTQVHL